MIWLTNRKARFIVVDMKTIFQRYVAKAIEKDLGSGKSVLLLGPRQVGKTTMIREGMKKRGGLREILLQNPETRIRYEQNPGDLIRDIEAGGEINTTILIDEIQKVPALFDAVQYLIDIKKYNFILTGSSARKLRRNNTNLLPGRIMLNYLDPLMWGEMKMGSGSGIEALKLDNLNNDVKYSIEEMMVYGTLPEIVGAKNDERSKLLYSYATTYLEEEVRAEALVRQIGSFVTMLQIVAQESGGVINLTKLSQAIGVSLPTVREYFAILQDTLILHELPVYSHKVRTRLVAAKKYYLFDMGVRNALRRVPMELDLINVEKGAMFEHVVILEMMRRKRLFWDRGITLSYWRTRTGLEVDLVIEIGERIIPIEIKASRDVRLGELKGLVAFMEQYNVEQGYVITMDDQPQKISDKIVALPWSYV